MFDGLLTAWLVLIFPAYSCWASLHKPAKTPPRTDRYIRTIMAGLVPVLALIGLWITGHRSPSALGLGPPTALPALIGFGVAGLVIIVLSAVSIANKAEPSGEQWALFPEARREWPLFVAFSFTVGGAWEVLYRGYLLWVLGPFIGTVGAVLVAAVAYGLAHGIADRKRVAGSLISALLFTTGYALTRNLWWLMLIHTVLPLIVGLGAMRRRAMTPAPEVAIAAGLDDHAERI